MLTFQLTFQFLNVLYYFLYQSPFHKCKIFLTFVKNKNDSCQFVRIILQMSLRETILLSIFRDQGFSVHDIVDEYKKKDTNSIPTGSLHTTLSRMVKKGFLTYLNKIYTITDKGAKELEKTLNILGFVDYTKYKTFFNSINDAVLIHKKLRGYLPGQIIEANDIAVKLFEYSKEELLQMSPRDFECPQAYDKHIQLTAQKLKKDNNCCFESAFYTKSHQLIPVEVNVRIFEWDKPCFVCIIRDISNYKRLESALWGSELGTWNWNVQTGEAHVSSSWTKMLGYEVGELDTNYSAWEKSVHQDDLSRITKLLQDHFNEKTPFYQATFRMKHRSGDWVQVKAQGKVITRASDGAPLQVAGTQQIIELSL